MGFGQPATMRQSLVGILGQQGDGFGVGSIRRFAFASRSESQPEVHEQFDALVARRREVYCAPEERGSRMDIPSLVCCPRSRGQKREGPVGEQLGISPVIP